MLSRKSCLCLFGAALAMAALTTGCRSHHDNRHEDSQPAEVQPAQNETVIYNQWEVETHRAHKDISQRPVEEQKEYSEWRQKRPGNH